jgi:glutamate-1-semialdehyde 2,1-aminomutase
MEIDTTVVALSALGVAAAGATAFRLSERLALSRAKHPSLAGHARMARRIAAMIPAYSYDEKDFFRADDAPADVARRREVAFFHLADKLAQRCKKTIAQTAALADGLSDLQFTSSYRVPFQFREMVQRHLKSGSIIASSAGVTITDLDGNIFYDLTGSYGVNVFGVDFYKTCIAEAEAEARAVGPLLGRYTDKVVANVERLKAISGLDEVSFHMSGTEAVMQAVRLARYHTGRKRVVRFCGAYHGWWGGVQPGIGNPVPARDTLTLNDISERTLRIIRTRRDIACVLVNPLQALHPNAGAPSDSMLVDSGRGAAFDREAYGAWLNALREACTAAGVVLIFDEVFVGFRLARRGAQEYFGVNADMVTYGKTLGGGLPIGVVCGRADLMKRFRPERPLDICFARGTFNAHPYVMAAMDAFLRRIEEQPYRDVYHGLDEVWDARALTLNKRLAIAGLPVRVANLSSIWTVLYSEPSRYNWMLQYYLQAEGLALSWVGTGRLIFSLNYTEAEFAEVANRFVAAAAAMQQDGWWWRGHQLTNRRIRRRVLREVIARRLFGPRP